MESKYYKELLSNYNDSLTEWVKDAKENYDLKDFDNDINELIDEAAFNLVDSDLIYYEDLLEVLSCLEWDEVADFVREGNNLENAIRIAYKNDLISKINELNLI